MRSLTGFCFGISVLRIFMKEGKMASSRRKRKMTEDRFLADHQLEDTIETRKFAQYYINQTSPTVVRIVNEFKAEGCRLRPADVHTILKEAGIELEKTASKPFAAPTAEQSEKRVRAHLLKAGDLAAAGAQKASGFSETLDSNARDLALTAADGEEGAVTRALVEIIRKMKVEADGLHENMKNMVQETANLKTELENTRAEADRDYLTGLPNMRAAKREFAKLEKSGEKYAVAFCDVDDFKRINDTYSHTVGDRVLKSVAEDMSECAGKNKVYRWGGEEFVIVFPGLSVSVATSITNRAREKLLDRHFKVRDTDKPLNSVSFSAGVAGGEGHHMPIVDRSDKLMYDAKAAGKNRVVSEPQGIITRIAEHIVG